MKMLEALTSFAITALLIKLAMAETLTVGGPGGWDTSSSPQTWAASQKFSLGDNLNFMYTPNHDVLEVTKPDYDSCQTSNPLKTLSGGASTVTLSSPGKRYFICGTAGHCSQGMKMEVTTLAASITPPATPPATPPKSTSKPPASSPVTSPKAPAASVVPPANAPSPAVPVPHSSSPTGSPVTSPASSPDVPSTESPGTSLSPVGSSPSPAASSANKAIAMGGLSFGIAFLIAFLATGL